MSEEKRSKNPFINLAREAKKSGIPGAPGKTPESKIPRMNTRGFGAPSVVRRSGRGG